MGKTDVVSNGALTAAHVAALLCDGSCQAAYPSQTCAYAVSGDVTKGGATYTARTDGLGPTNSVLWSGTNDFGTSGYY